MRQQFYLPDIKDDALNSWAQIHLPQPLLWKDLPQDFKKATYLGKNLHYILQADDNTFHALLDRLLAKVTVFGQKFKHASSSFNGIQLESH